VTFLIEAIRALMVSGFAWGAIRDAVASLAVTGLILQLGTLWAFGRLTR
jgi:hypothetical protein